MVRSREDYLSGINRLIDLEEANRKLLQELRDPLSVVIRYASLIRMETHEIATRQHIEKLYLEAMNASKVLDTLLLHSSGTTSSMLGVVDLNIILTQTIALLRYQMQTSGIVLDALLAEEALPVKGDSLVLQQSFYLALVTALQLQGTSGDEKKITIWSRIDGDMIRVDITLSPCGLTMHKGRDPQAQFFETIEKGMGVGWYTLKRNIADHGGSIAVAGGDSFTVTIRLPTAGLQTPAEDASQGCVKCTLKDMPSGRPSALIIDDEAITAEVTAEMMAHLGFETISMHDPISAVPILRDRHFDLIIIDNQLPKITGISFIREYAPLLRGSSITLMTGEDMVDMPEIAGIHRVNLLRKPFALKELKCLVQEMKKSDQRRENK